MWPRSFVTLSLRRVQLRASVPLQSDSGIRPFWGSAIQTYAFREKGEAVLCTLSTEFWLALSCLINVSLDFKLIQAPAFVRSKDILHMCKNHTDRHHDSTCSLHTCMTYM